MPRAYVSYIRRGDEKFSSPAFSYLHDLITFIRVNFLREFPGLSGDELEDVHDVLERFLAVGEVDHQVVYEDDDTTMWIERFEIYPTYQAWINSR